MSTSSHLQLSPWYREPWPWLLMAGPAVVVVAGLFTAWLAVVHEDGLVADDYYKQGLGINKVLEREKEAASLEVHARVLFGDNRVRVFLIGAAPEELKLLLVHPTRAGLDRTARLSAGGAGWYEGAIDTRGTRWHVVIEDAAGRWRLRGDWNERDGNALEFGTAARHGPSQ